jgi:hypothetical protein
MNLFKKTLLATAVMAVSGGALAVPFDTTVNDNNTDPTTGKAVVRSYSAEGFEAGVILNDGYSSDIFNPESVLNGVAGGEIDADVQSGDYLIASEYVADRDFVVVALDGAIFTGTPKLSATALAVVNGSDDSTTPLLAATDLAVDATTGFPAPEIQFSDAEFRNGDRSVAYFTVEKNTLAATTADKSDYFTFKLKIDEPKIKLDSTAVGAKASISVKSYQPGFGGDADKEFNKGGSTDLSRLNIAEVENQFSFDMKVGEELDAVIDVAQERKGFEGQADNETQVESFTTNFIEKNGLVGAVILSASELTVSGDFSSFSGEDKNGVFSNGDTEITLADDLQKATLDFDASKQEQQFDFTIGEEQTAMAPTSYTASLVLTVNNNKEFVLETVDAGAMTLNGRTAQIDYVPYGENLEQFIWVTNDSAQTGDVSVIARLEDGTPVDLGVIAESTPGLVKLDTVIAEALAAEGFTSGRAALEITINTPKEKTSIYGAYKVKSADDRLGLVVENMK